MIRQEYDTEQQEGRHLVGVVDSRVARAAMRGLERHRARQLVVPRRRLRHRVRRLPAVDLHFAKRSRELVRRERLVGAAVMIRLQDIALLHKPQRWNDLCHFERCCTLPSNSFWASCAGLIAEHSVSQTRDADDNAASRDTPTRPAVCTDREGEVSCAHRAGHGGHDFDAGEGRVVGALALLAVVEAHVVRVLLVERVARCARRELDAPKTQRLLERQPNPLQPHSAIRSSSPSAANEPGMCACAGVDG